MEKKYIIPKNKEKLKNLISSIPGNPGIYQFTDNKDDIIYIGKAKNLKRRITQYFQVSHDFDQKTGKLIGNIEGLRIIITLNEFDALLLEAKLINLHKPKYNIIAKDDKSPIYIKISLSDELPYITFIRNSQFQDKKTKFGSDIKFGPFQRTSDIKSLMREIRKIIPYCTQKIRNGKPCFYTHLEYCNPCPSYISKIEDKVQKSLLTKIYRSHISDIKKILNGNIRQVEKKLLKIIKIYADNFRYEEATKARDQLLSLKTLMLKSYEPMNYYSHISFTEKVSEVALSNLRTTLNTFMHNTINQLTRIECFDISIFYGRSAVGSMVVMENGLPNSSQYRRFKIKRIEGINDTQMMAEVIDRRLKHDLWPKPDLIVVDGGKGQISAVESVINRHSNKIPVIGLAKKYEDIIVPLNPGYKILKLEKDKDGLQILIRLRDEAHRFAYNYQKYLREQSFIN